MVSQWLAPVVLAVESVILLLLAIYLLYLYGDIRRQNKFVTALTLCIWFLSFFTVFLLPIDVSSAFYNDCLSTKTVPGNCSAPKAVLAADNGSNCSYNCSLLVCSDHSLPSSKEDECSSLCPEGQYAFICQYPMQVLWSIINWLFTILTWTVLPLLQSYVMATYFSIKKKILRVIVENIIFYASLLVVAIIVLISLLAGQTITIEFIPTLVFTAVNTWGLLVLTVLLGYGLVEVPRSLWNASRRGWSLNYCYFKAAKLYSDMCEAADTLAEMKEKVCKLSKDISYTDPMRKYVDLIIKKIPDDMRAEFSHGRDDFEDFKLDDSDVLTKKSLEKVYQKTIKAVRRKHRTAIEWVDLTDRALDLEDTASNATSGSRKFTSSVRKPKKDLFHSLLATVEWYWKVLLRHWVYRVCAVLLSLFSLIIVWSEATFGIPDVRLSIIANIIYLGHDNTNYIVIELTSIVTVAYLSVCAYYTVFKIRIFNFYYLTPRHCTDEYSLLFSAMLLSRLAIPICLNYLYVINVVELEHSRDDVPITAFQLALGNTDLIPWLTSGFNIYYPIIIALICLATFFKLAQRLLSLFGYQTFIGEDDFSADYIDEGKALMKRERRNRERALGRGELRAMLQKGSIVDEILKDGERPAHRKPAELSNRERFAQSLKSFKNMKSLGKTVRKHGTSLETGVQYSRGSRESTEFEEDTVKLIPNDEPSGNGRSSSVSTSHGSLMGPRRDLFGDL